jgi:hypothetical protein
MEKISWTDHVRNEEGLQRVKKERKDNWVCHVLLRNCLLKHIIEGKIKVKGRRGRRRKQLPGIRKKKIIFLISNFRRVLNVVCFLLGNSPKSEFYIPKFRNTLSVPSS